MAPVAMTSGALIVQFILGLSAMHNESPEPRVRESLATVESSLAALEQAITRKDWGEIEKQSRRMTAFWDLFRRGAAAPTLLAINDQAKIDQLRTELKSARDAFDDILRAVESKDEDRLQRAAKQFHDAFDPVQETAKRP
jgi:DNA-binding GntR family transcriptional regulator